MPRRAPSRKRVGPVGLLSIFSGHVFLLVSLFVKVVLFKLASAETPAGDALSDISEHGLTDHTLT